MSSRPTPDAEPSQRDSVVVPSGESRDDAAALIQRQRFETLGRLTSGVFHDVNNALGVIAGSAEYLALLDRFERRGPAYDEAVADILEGVRHAAEVSHQLLSLARGGRHITLLQLDELCEEAAAMARRSLEPRVSLSLHLEPDVHAIGSRAELVLAILQLLVNARDAVLAVGRSRVELRLERQGSRAAIIVSDEGPGMRPAVKQQAFEPFFSTKGSGRGFGLGLSTVREVMRQHDGDAEVVSVPGEGSVFRLTLPTTDPGPGPNRFAPRRAKGLPLFVGLRILVVDDEPSFRRGVERLLRREAAEVASASTGREALGVLLDNPDFDLVIVDSDMPDGDGPWLLRQLEQADWRRVPMLGMSGHRVGDSLLASGADAFIAKPFTREELLQACEGLLSV